MGGGGTCIPPLGGMVGRGIDGPAAVAVGLLMGLGPDVIVHIGDWSGAVIKGGWPKYAPNKEESLNTPGQTFVNVDRMDFLSPVCSVA